MWNETAALWDFVAGSGFSGIIESFGCPAILTWLPLSIEIRLGLRRDAVRLALREDMPIPIDTDLPAFRKAQAGQRSRNCAAGGGGQYRALVHGPFHATL